ncbi:ABC transporter permease [Pseudooceanicola pacificus]|uniref:ABC transporter permease n=1 Tax=Pseudooceanicola pacificus TaxID=2676438 RepID=UPI001365D8A7|nr:ABC transporter permease [Pseudooceanicola pacificus]
MIRFVGLRLLMAVPTLVLVTLAVFVMMRLVPSDPASVMLGEQVTGEMVARVRQSMGLDQPLPRQYLLWIGDLLQGDLGRSISNNQPVLPTILDRFRISAPIVIVAVTLAALIAVPLGLLTAWRQGSACDVSTVATSTLLPSLPSFWLGLMILLVFGLKLGWFPVLGMVGAIGGGWAVLSAIAMPVLTLLLIEIGAILQMTRPSAVEVLRQDYITHARAKGLSEAVVLRRHAFPDAFAPTWTLIDLILGALLGGIAVVETVFTIPGLGRLPVQAIFERDYPVVQGCILLIALT